MYRVFIELQQHEWKFVSTRNAVGTRAARQVFPQLFQVLPNFHEIFLYLDKNIENICSFSFRNHREEERETTCLLRSSKCKFSLLTPSLYQQLVLVLCFHRVIEIRFLTNQRTYLLRAVLFTFIGRYVASFPQSYIWF